MTPVASPFCLAVSDGMASSNYSQHCSKVVVKAIKKLWQNSVSSNQTITSNYIHNLISQTKHSAKRHGAAANLAMVIGKFDSDGALKATITHVGDSRVY